ncbi:MAG TPA: hypothetical protein VMG10_08845, partial [Gemmataceae bacterium]|nr:hypothetical protein [Gemmataceae bacterium]
GRAHRKSDGASTPQSSDESFNLEAGVPAKDGEPAGTNASTKRKGLQGERKPVVAQLEGTVLPRG